jgi:hypothetical protein
MSHLSFLLTIVESDESQLKHSRPTNPRTISTHQSRFRESRQNTAGPKAKDKTSSPVADFRIASILRHQSRLGVLQCEPNEVEWEEIPKRNGSDEATAVDIHFTVIRHWVRKQHP